MNGLFTVAGGFISVLISMGYGFNVAIGVALGLYAAAFGVFRRLYRAEFDAAVDSLPRTATAPSIG
jgi:hypothetical protein